MECFKVFLYNFQYPGAHIKPKNVLEQIENGIHFKPAQYILKLLKFANREGGNLLVSQNMKLAIAFLMIFV